MSPQEKWGSTEPKFGAKTRFRKAAIRTKPPFWSNMTAATRCVASKECWWRLTGKAFPSARRNRNVVESTAELDFVHSLRLAVWHLHALRFGWELEEVCSKARPSVYIRPAM